MRVTIEGSTLGEGRFYKLTEDYFEGSRAEAIGTLTLLWFDSQEREFISGTKEQIKEFFPYFNDADNEDLFKSLVKYGYIKEVSAGQFEIAGNERHVVALQNLKASRSKAGKASGRARRNQKPTEREHTLNKREHVLNANEQKATQLNVSAVQCSSVQYSAIQNKEEKRVSAKALPHLAHLWNSLAGENLAKVKDCGSSRRSQCQARWSEHPHDDYWEEVIKKIKNTPFCNGSNERGWKADFDFLIKPETSTRVLEGKYDDVRRAKNSLEDDLRREGLLGS